MKEQFVQYEQFATYKIAMKLKEKGFREFCFTWYFEDTQDLYEGFVLSNHNELFGCTSAPLWQQVIDWLMEEHEIEIVISGITVYGVRKYSVCLYYKVDNVMTDHSLLLFNEENGDYAGYQTFTYQEARQTAIEYALTLI